MDQILKVIGIIAYIPFMFLVMAWTGATLWEWFIVSTFHLPVLSLPQAYGVTMVANYFTGLDFYDDPDEDKYTKLFKPVFAALIFVMIGWVVKQFL